MRGHCSFFNLGKVVLEFSQSLLQKKKKTKQENSTAKKLKVCN